jgi:hypothetical protein
MVLSPHLPPHRLSRLPPSALPTPPSLLVPLHRPSMILLPSLSPSRLAPGRLSLPLPGPSFPASPLSARPPSVTSARPPWSARLTRPMSAPPLPRSSRLASLVLLLALLGSLTSPSLVLPPLLHSPWLSRAHPGSVPTMILWVL